MAPSSTKQWTVTGTDKGFDGLVYGEAQVPKVGENDVLVKIQGASLNYRDLIIPLVCPPKVQQNAPPDQNPIQDTTLTRPSSPIGPIPLPPKTARGPRLRRRR